MQKYFSYKHRKQYTKQVRQMLKEMIFEMIDSEVTDKELREILQFIGFYKDRHKDLKDFTHILLYLSRNSLL